MSSALRQRERLLRKLLERRLREGGWPFDVGVIRCDDDGHTRATLEIDFSSQTSASREPVEIVDVWIALLAESVGEALEFPAAQAKGEEKKP